jgi:hypothetical protein
MTATKKSTTTANEKASTSAVPSPTTRTAPSIAPPAAVAKLAPKAPAKRVTRKVALATTKTAEKTPVKATITSAVKPVEKPVLKASVTPATLPKADKSAKAKKPKLVRDSFTIPKGEYTVLDELKQRTTRLNSAVKKSELIRAGIKALAAMSDTAFLTALKAVPTIKTGRPTKAKPD